MIRRLGGYVGVSYPPPVYLPWTVCWAVGLTALFSLVTAPVARWRPDGELAVTAVTLVVAFLLVRALDDIRDLDYDRRHNPGRPLPSGAVRERDLGVLIAVGAAFLLLLNAGRGVALAALAAQMAYTGAVIALDRAGWPDADRLWLALAVNAPIQILLSLYVYAGFLRAEHLAPSAAGLLGVAAVTVAALCMELGRKVTRRPRPHERTYVTALGVSGTSLAALAAAVAGTGLVLLAAAPWRPGQGPGWLVLASLALPVLAAVRFAAGAARWPLLPTVLYLPVLYCTFLAAALLSQGAPS
jgi:hypothetical protein